MLQYFPVCHLKTIICERVFYSFMVYSFYMVNQNLCQNAYNISNCCEDQHSFPSWKKKRERRSESGSERERKKETKKKRNKGEIKGRRKK